MASTFGSYEIAKSGMMTYNKAIQTTAHNVANIHTKGYSKQVANTTSMTCNRSGFLVQGAGVLVTDISRRRNEYFDTKYQHTNSTYYQYSTENYYLKSIENSIAYGVTTDDDARLTTVFDNFTKVLSSMVGNADNDTIRRSAVTTAQTFTSFIQEAADNMQTLQDEANTEIKTCVEQINAYADKIVSINKQINTIEAYGSVANDLRDQRGVLIDELSQFCEVEIREIAPPDGIGDNQYYVYMNGGVLVDTYNANKLTVVQKDSYTHINDVKGCYDITWSNGAYFNTHARDLGGKLQSLFEIRDGNNDTVLEGQIEGLTDTELVLSNTNCDSVLSLNIPAHDGEIVVNGLTFCYDSFEVTKNGDKFVYTFQMRDVNPSNVDAMKKAQNNQSVISVGAAVNYKGIPYYMAQLNEFVRTYASRFNEVQNEGFDLEGNPGMDFFNAKMADTGKDFTTLKEVETGFTSLPQADKNADGTDKTDVLGNKIYTGSYYYMTAVNFCVSETMDADPGRIAAKSDPLNGDDEAITVDRLSKLKDDSKMFIHGTPDSFIQSLTSTIGVNSRRAATMEEAQSDLLYAIDTNRQSISGVDEDEEGADMLIFQNMLFNQYKVLSVLNEVINKLINETAV